MTNSEGERMAILETKVNNLDQKITDVAVDVKAIMVTLSKQPSLEAKIIGLETEIHEIKASSNLWKWLAPTLTAVLTAGVTFLLIQYIQKL